MRSHVYALLEVLACSPTVCYADTVATFNFDTLPKGPSTFAQAGPPQTIIDPGVVTFTGGVVLGTATNFPGIVYATAPNAYATAGFGDGTPNLLTLTIAPGFTANEVSFALFNGATIPSSYLVSAYGISGLLTSQTFSNLSSNTNSGYALPDLIANNITSVTIKSLTNDPAAQGYDYLIDTVAINESVQQSVGVTPEPSSLALLGTGIVGMVGAARRRFAYCGK